MIVIAKHDPTETIDAIAKYLTAVKIQVIDEVYQIEEIEFS
jgi:membrane-bound lytic murein transglycosylase MltF